MNGPPLKHDRDLSKFRDGYGIKAADYAEKIQLEERIRMGVTVDDASHLVAPVAVPVAGFRLDPSAVVAEFGGSRLTVNSPGGAWLITATATVGGVRCQTILPGVWLTQGAVAPVLVGGDGRPPLSVVDEGSATIIGTGFELPQFGGHLPCLPTWFAYASVVYFVHTTATVAVPHNFFIQEVP